MGIAASLARYLCNKGIDYTVVEHPYSEGSVNTAIAAQIPPKQLAKAVLFRDEDFNYTLAVLPSCNKVKRYTINQIFAAQMELASEEEVDHLFRDCQHGAVPAAGEAYDLNVIWDDELTETDFIWIEAGDHRNLIRLDVGNFKRLMADAMHEHFSTDQRYRRPPKMVPQPYQMGLF